MFMIQTPKKYYMFQKLILCISLSAIFCTTTLAQTFDARIFVGLNASQVSGDELAGFHQPGLNFGAEISTELKSFDLSFGITFSQKGSRATSNNSGGNAFYRLRLNYLDIPVILSKSFDKLSIGVGPSINVLVKSTEADIFGNTELTLPFNTLDIAALAQVGYRLTDHIAIRLSYGLSVLPIRKFNNSPGINNGQYNEWLSTGILFLL